MAGIIDHCVHLSTDLADFERFLRLVQSIIHILATSPSVMFLVLPYLTPTSPPLATALATTLAVRDQINLVRRTLRLFRFVETFRAAGDAMARFSKSPGAMGAVMTSLDAAALSLLGVYGMLESATLPDMYGVPAFGEERAAKVNEEAQRCWLVALGCLVLAGGLRVVGGSSGNKNENKSDGGKDAKAKKDDKEKKGDKEKDDSEDGKLAIGWRMAADGLDVTLPVSALGWAPQVEQWVVGTAMLATTMMRMSDS